MGSALQLTYIGGCLDGFLFQLGIEEGSCAGLGV
jgi:hypothetical protein